MWYVLKLIFRELTFNARDRKSKNLCANASKYLITSHPVAAHGHLASKDKLGNFPCYGPSMLAALRHITLRLNRFA